MTKPIFRITHRDSSTRARTGILRTAHGIVRTPAYVIVATHAEVRTLKPADLKKTKTQLVIANTYHLWDARAVHKKLGVRMPMMTDSGGFQVFSFGAAKEQGVGKVLKQPVRRSSPTSTVRITERGVHFVVDGTKRFISPELSIATQKRLGADMIFAFDECTSPLHPHAHTKAAMQRTHRWALRCLKAHKGSNQMLLGIVQGGRFSSLRRQSARIIGAMPFDGFGIGGSFGKDEMRKTLDWVVPYLPEEKYKHLLGIGTVQDIFNAVEAGMDTFDCVIPTREARHARIYTNTGPIDVRKTKYATSTEPLMVSRSTIGALHRLFRAHDQKAGRLATLHNVRWFNALLEQIRAALADGSYASFKKKFLKTFTRPSRS